MTLIPPSSQLLGHKGGGSIFSLLRREGLAHHVVATHKRFDLSDFSFMLLTIQVPLSCQMMSGKLLIGQIF
jgi:hypothetical protein